jgi:hypothetical protein
MLRISWHTVFIASSMLGRDPLLASLLCAALAVMACSAEALKVAAIALGSACIDALDMVDDRGGTSTAFA